MATKNIRNKQKKQSENAVVYNVTIALMLLCLGLVALRKLHNTFATVGGMAFLEPLLPIAIGVGFVLCLACIALYIFRKTPASSALAPWLAFLFGSVGVVALSMKIEYTFGFPVLYFLWGAVLVQYIIYQLYRWEFFLFSLPTAAAGFLFYLFRNGVFFSAKSILLLIATAIIIIAVLWIANNAARNKGQLVMGKKSIRLFSKRYSPFLHYLVAALWAVCLLAAIILGGLFSFYCMFAAIAVEFIAAVYYTFQLN